MTMTTTSEDIKFLCRLCGSKTRSDNRLNIFDSTGMLLEINTKISNCLSIDVSENDNLPKVLCTECVNNIENFHSFKIRSHEISFMLQDLFQSNDESSADNADENLPSNIFEPELNITINDEFSNVLTTKAVAKHNKKLHKSKGIKNPPNITEKPVVKKNNIKKDTKTQIKTKPTVSKSVYRYTTQMYSSLKCDFCSKEFSKRRAIRCHMHVHLWQKRYNCPYCSKKLKSESGLKNHIQRHERQYDFICNYCGNGFFSKVSFETHIRTIHTKDLPFQCNKCDKKFATKYTLKSHYDNVHADRMFSCDICNKTCNSKNYLNCHKKMHEVPIEQRKKLKCTFCPATFRSKSALARHMMKHTGETPFLCRICNNGYTSRRGLDIHMLTHSGVRDFICDFCGKAFALKRNLEVHRAIHTGERKYKCKDCGKKFTQNSSLNRHKKSGCTGK